MQKKASRKALRILGRNIFRLRGAAGLSQDKLAVKADITKRYLQMLEAGQKSPTLKILKQLRQALACAYEDLLQGF